MSTTVIRPGRPRSSEVDDAILDAAIEQFAEAGYDALSVEGVAQRAGVAKTTIYRRYPTKLDLVMAATSRASTGMIPVPGSGNLRTDLLAVAHGFTRMLTQSTAGRCIPMTLAAKVSNPELAAAHEQFVATRRAITVNAIQAGIDRGELPPDTDPAMIADMITGAIFLRVFVTGQPVDDAYMEALVDRTIAG